MQKRGPSTMLIEEIILWLLEFYQKMGSTLKMEILALKIFYVHLTTK